MEATNFEEVRKEYPSLIPLNGKDAFELGWQLWCDEVRPFNPEDFKNRNVGIPCGPANGIIVLDVDIREEFTRLKQKNNWDLPSTRTHGTGNGGLHYIYQYPQDGKQYGNRSRKNKSRETIFDIKGLGGQVVAPGSIHPDTGEKYTILSDKEIAPAPQWMLDLALKQDSPPINKTPSQWNGNLESLGLAYPVKRLIQDGEVKGKRSEAIASVLSALLKKGVSEKDIFNIFDNYAIGEKYREKGRTKDSWLQGEIRRIREFTNAYISPKGDVAGDPPTMGDLKAYLDFEVGPGQPFTSDGICKALGAFKRSDRQNIYKGLSRLVESGELKRDPYKHGYYRRVSAIPSYDLTCDVGVNDTLGISMPMGLSDLIEVKCNQLIGVSGRYDSGKSSFLFEIEAKNYPNFKIAHILSEEWSLPAIKERQEILGIPVPHPNITFYPMLPGWEDLIPQGPSITLIDYIRADQNPYEVDAQIQRVLRNLKGGVAFFASQKHPGLDRPVGGQFAVHSVHHILMLDRWKDLFICKVFRTKNERNLEGYFRTFSFNKKKCLVPEMEDWKKGTVKWEKKDSSQGAD